MYAAVTAIALGALYASMAAPAAALECLTMIRSVATYPGGDIAVRDGDPLVINCTVEPPFDSSQLKFSKRSPSGLQKCNSEILDATTAQLYIARPERQDSTYDCVLETTERSDSCWNKVVVDSAPEEVKNFKCRSYNLSKLLCWWQPPIQYIKTDYFLSYTIIGTVSEECKVVRNRTTSVRTYSCVFGGSGASMYRKQEEFFIFNLTSKNMFGTLTQNLTIDHFAVLIPAKPSNLMKLELSAHSVLLQWHIPHDIADLSPFQPPLDHRIKYQIKTVNNLTDWILVADLSELHRVNSTTYRYKLEGLPYGHWQYDVRVYIKGVRAPDEEEFWAFEATTFTTESDRPPRPPLTALGAFQREPLSSGERTIYVYWQQLDEYEESGENFTYNLVATDGERRYTQSNRSGHAQFRASLRAYNVSITSFNNEGSSQNKSYIYIPADSDIQEKFFPRSFTKTVFGKKTYDLRWHPPQHKSFDSYTLFWCSRTDSELSEQCTGKLNFMTLNQTMKSQRINVAEDGKTYEFAISANRGVLSSGMVWATCTLPAEGATNKVAEFQRKGIGSRYVELKWDLGCTFSEGYVKGYQVTYCQVKKNSKVCTGNNDYNYTINDPEQKSVNITGLVPHATYEFHVYVIYNDGLGYPSVSVGATTLEEKPSLPLALKLTHVTNKSMIVSWNPPAVKNGFLKKYVVKYCINGSYVCEENVSTPNSQDSGERQEYRLQDLHPFTNYTVRVEACTTDCSDAAEAGVVRTAFGAPSRIPEPYLNETTLYWQRPEVPGGTLDYFEIRIIEDDKVIKTYNTTDLEKRNIDLCNIVSNGKTLLYQVRAVNLDSDKDHGALAIQGDVTLVDMPEGQRLHAGEWSHAARLSCHGSYSIAVLYWSLGAVMLIFLTVTTVLASRKIWIRLKKMTDIGPVLPPGLGPTEEKDASKYPLGGAWSPPSKGKEERVFPCVAGDEMLLLPPHSGSSNSTDSTTLSLTSKGPGDREAAPSDDTSDDSSLRLHAETVDSAPPPLPAAPSGYKAWSNRPSAPAYDHDDEDADSTGSEDLSEPALPSGYVQTGTLPLPTLLPPLPEERHNPILNIPAGYVRARDESMFPPNVASMGSPGAISKLMPAGDLLTPKFLPMEWKLPTTRPAASETSKPQVAAQPAAGYVSHADAIINKHLEMVSGGRLGEQPALPDPDMSPEAYCRFAWNSDPASDNLGSLLNEEPSAAPHLFTVHAPK